MLRGEAAVRCLLGGFFRAQARAAAEVLLGEVAKTRSGEGRNRGSTAMHEGGDEGLAERGGITAALRGRGVIGGEGLAGGRGFTIFSAG
jgi:hypothetical protein